MRKYIEIPLEVLERLVDGKYVEGSLHRDAWSVQQFSKGSGNGTNDGCIRS